MSRTFAVEGDTVTVAGLTRTRRATVDPARYQEVKDFFNALARDTDRYIVLKKAQ